MKDKNLLKFGVFICVIGLLLIGILSFKLVVTASNNSTENTAVVTNGDNLTFKEDETLPIPQQKVFEDVEIEFVRDSSNTYNEMGEILVLMYHGLTPTDVKGDIIHRSIQGFKDDLQSLYDNNYRTISMDDYINKNINLEAGYSPVVITFDDGLNTAFSFDYIDNELIPKKDCAVDILNKFYEKHPTFGRNATFFVYNSQDMFNGYGTLMDKYNYLIYNGYDIGNHSYSHANLASLNEPKLFQEIGDNHNTVLYNSENYSMKAIAYPYGNLPKEKYMDTLFENTYYGIDYKYEVGFLAFLLDEYSTNPFSYKFDPYKIPRTRGTNNEPMDLGYFLNYYKNNPKEKYVSDGNNDVLTVPKNYFDKVDLELVKEKELNIRVISN